MLTHSLQLVKMKGEGKGERGKGERRDGERRENGEGMDG